VLERLKKVPSGPPRLEYENQVHSRVSDERNIYPIILVFMSILFSVYQTDKKFVNVKNRYPFKKEQE
jgi:hypothetical protein